MSKYYQWRKITDDGLLLLPTPMGFNWSKESINGSLGYFDTEKEAEEAYEDFMERYPYNGCGMLTLITLYRDY